MKSQPVFGRSFLLKKELKRKRLNYLRLKRELNRVCRRAVFFTMMRARIGGVERGAPKRCPQGNREDLIQKFFLIFKRRMTQPSEKNATRTAIADGLWKLATRYSWNLLKRRMVPLVSFPSVMWTSAADSSALPQLQTAITIFLKSMRYGELFGN